jgi:hypothetical protein
MEVKRVARELDEISARLKYFSSIVDGIPREFIFNIDETGCSDHSHRREVIELVNYPDPSVSVPSDRHSNCSTLVEYTPANGFRMMPFAIVPGFTSENEPRYCGYDESNLLLTSQSNAFMMRALFELWVKIVCFSIINQHRRDLGYQSKALLLMDGLESHHTE